MEQLALQKRAHIAGGNKPSKTEGGRQSDFFWFFLYSAVNVLMNVLNHDAYEELWLTNCQPVGPTFYTSTTRVDLVSVTGLLPAEENMYTAKYDSIIVHNGFL